MSAHPIHACTCHGILDRRTVFRLLGLGAASMAMPRLALAGQADALVLNCMDYRLVDEGPRYFRHRGMTNKYDQVILAGGSIGALGKLGPEWAATFWKHVETAKALHHIHKVIVLDHRDCGAYKIVFGADSIADRDEETALHRSQMIVLRDEIKARHPDLETEMAIMDLDGSVQDLLPGARNVSYRVPRPKPKAPAVAQTADATQGAAAPAAQAPAAPAAPAPAAPAPAAPAPAAHAPAAPAPAAPAPAAHAPAAAGSSGHGGIGH
jgi:hypothetical protein